MKQLKEETHVMVIETEKAFKNSAAILNKYFK